MNEYALARALHVLGVVLWIGGVAMVTTVLLPAVRRFKSPEERVAFFEQVEGRFARQARWTTALVGLTGFWLTWRFDLWWRFADPAYWWMHAMVIVWAIFTLMLFVIEPFFLRNHTEHQATHDPVGTFRRVQRLHWFLLAISLITIVGAVAGAHGGL
ncbi:MAG TPA: hypothetical protein VK025_10535 [Steroidobacter sp.]|nr:hypothetical protein [Steroidobacter sp.]